jgi:8-oxo-dGTP diphosphatase
MDPTPEESRKYYASLPRKRMAAGSLFFNDRDELLIVKPNYKDGWLIPGGTVEANESPRVAAIRETKEEIGLDISKQQMLCLDYVTYADIAQENIQFIFYGGVLTQNQIDSIQLQNDELDEFKFVSTSDAVKILRPRLARRLPHCLEALRTNTVAYLENGEIV